MTPLVITSTRSGSATGCLLAALEQGLIKADCMYVETGVLDPRVLATDGLSTPVVMSEQFALFSPPSEGRLVVGLSSAAALGWRRWDCWRANGWCVVVVHEGAGDILHHAAMRDVPGLTWVFRDDFDANVALLKRILHS